MDTMTPQVRLNSEQCVILKLKKGKNMYRLDLYWNLQEDMLRFCSRMFESPSPTSFLGRAEGSKLLRFVSFFKFWKWMKLFSEVSRRFFLFWPYRCSLFSKRAHHAFLWTYACYRNFTKFCLYLANHNVAPVEGSLGAILFRGQHVLRKIIFLKILSTQMRQKSCKKYLSFHILTFVGSFGSWQSPSLHANNR